MEWVQLGIRLTNPRLLKLTKTGLGNMVSPTSINVCMKHIASMFMTWSLLASPIYSLPTGPAVQGPLTARIAGWAQMADALHGSANVIEPIVRIFPRLAASQQTPFGIKAVLRQQRC